MAKCLVRNEIGGRTFGFVVPADSTETQAFCDAHLEGTYAIFEEVSKSGSDEVTSVNNVVVTGKAEDGRKATISFYANINFSEDEIRSALLGKTYNDVKFDEVFIINMSRIEIAG